MDYSLGFFEAIITEALKKVKEEFENPKKRTGWISSITPRDLDLNENDPQYFIIQAQHLLDNYASIFIQILSHLLLRREPFDRVINIEFNDAKTRLNDEKIDKIIALDGPFWSRRSTQLILKSVFIY